LIDHLSGLPDLTSVAAQVRLVSRQIHLGGILELCFAHLHIFGNVDQHRAGPTRLGDVEGLFHRSAQLPDVGHEVIVLGDGHGDASNVCFLEAVGAQHRCGHLSGDGDDGR